MDAREFACAFLDDSALTELPMVVVEGPDEPVLHSAGCARRAPALWSALDAPPYITLSGCVGPVFDDAAQFNTLANCLDVLGDVTTLGDLGQVATFHQYPTTFSGAFADLDAPLAAYVSERLTQLLGTPWADSLLGPLALRERFVLLDVPRWNRSVTGLAALGRRAGDHVVVTAGAGVVAAAVGGGATIHVEAVPAGVSDDLLDTALVLSTGSLTDALDLAERL